jgi:hypothetical protein
MEHGHQQHFISSRTTETRGTSVEGRGTSVEGRGTSVEGRGTSVEGRGTAVESRGTSVEGRGTEVETRRTAVERGTSPERRGTAVERGTETRTTEEEPASVVSSRSAANVLSSVGRSIDSMRNLRKAASWRSVAKGLATSHPNPNADLFLLLLNECATQPEP